MYSPSCPISSHAHKNDDYLSEFKGPPCPVVACAPLSLALPCRSRPGDWSLATGLFPWPIV